MKESVKFEEKPKPLKEQVKTTKKYKKSKQESQPPKQVLLTNPYKKPTDLPFGLFEVAE
jgi:hypothetical protein